MEGREASFGNRLWISDLIKKPSNFSDECILFPVVSAPW
jgi:hypothetical protein